MSMFSEMDGEHDRKELEKGITKAKRQTFAKYPQADTELVRLVLKEFVANLRKYCRENFVD